MEEIDVEKVLAQLTVVEKVNLLAGTYDIQAIAHILMFC